MSIIQDYLIKTKPIKYQHYYLMLFNKIKPSFILRYFSFSNPTNRFFFFHVINKLVIEKKMLFIHHEGKGEVKETFFWLIGLFPSAKASCFCCMEDYI